MTGAERKKLAKKISEARMAEVIARRGRLPDEQQAAIRRNYRRRTGR